MRYTKIVLLMFGLGLVLGLFFITAEIKSLERVASGLMALGIAAIPIGIAADMWRRAKRRSPTATRRAKAPSRRTTPAARRSRKPAPRKR